MPQKTEIISKNTENLINKHSRFLSRILEQEKPLFERIKKKGFQKQFDEIITDLNKCNTDNISKQDLMFFLRVKKRQASLLIALADISGAWDLKRTTNSLSDFADLAISKTVDFLISQKAKAKNLKSSEVNKSGYFVLAVGKLGGRELNYSSDVDLIILYDSESKNYIGKTNIKQFYISLTQELVEILQQFTSQGYVFRVDLRLRPDPYSTPIAISTKSAQTYYENVGQNWERAAMIKSRVITGGDKVTKKYLGFLESFIWRKYLDFEAINDIHSIKRQIDSQTDYTPDSLLGYNIKVGKGGIREIEFFVQVQQLIWGGREVELRSNETCVSLKTLQETGRLDKKDSEKLIQTYEFYRKIEHRLQMINDEATHSLPETEQEMEEFADFLEYKNAKAFEKDLTAKLALVQKYYAQLFTDAPTLGAEGNLVFTGVSDDPETLITLAKMGFSEPEKICTFMRGWHHGRRRATRTKRVREILTEITPILLESFANSTNPDVAFNKFDNFLAELPSGEQIFRLFNDRPKTIKLCAEIMGNSPWLAENFSRSPNLASKILRSDFNRSLAEIETIKKRLDKDLIDIEDIDTRLKIIRRWKHDMEFQAGIRLLKNHIGHDEALEYISGIAEIVIDQVLAESIKLNDTQKESIAIIAMGRLGEKQLTFGSDLDLVFIFEPKTNNSDAICKKVARTFTKTMSGISEDGILYPVDTRLRPQGDQGSIATSIKSYEKYYKDSAWSWEFMALTKARAVSGNKVLCTKTGKIINKFLTKKRDAESLRRDMFIMREKISKQFSQNNPWDIKYAQGGLFEIEFIIQYFKLIESNKIPELLKYNQEKFWRTLKNDSEISNKMCDELSDAFIFLRDIQSIIRLISQTGFNKQTASKNQKDLIVKNMDGKDFKDIENKLIEKQKTVHKNFNKIFN